MTTEANTRNHPLRYALLLNGSSFACDVLQNLQRLGKPPALLVLPEYPPAVIDASDTRNLLASQPQTRLLRLAGAIPFAYAPQARQAECARLIRQRALDFLLVACWPYRIAPVLVSSVARAALNLHPSLLPAWRGRDPIADQIEHGERRLGVSLHLLDQRFDAGDIVARYELPKTSVKPDRRTLERQCARHGCRLFVEAIERYDTGWQLQPQAGTASGGAHA